MGRPFAIAAILAVDAWTLGRCSGCFGIWTEKWASRTKNRRLPLEMQRVLNQSGYEKLAERIASHRCPYGRALIGDVTWPDPPEDLQSIIEPMGLLRLAAVIYSYLPYFVAVYVISLFVAVRGTRQLFVLAWLALFVLTNECIWKKLIEQPRPGTLLQVRYYDGKLAGSCVESCGMPSSHSGLASGQLVLIFLDASSRVRISADGEGSSTVSRRKRNIGKILTREGKAWAGFLKNCWMLPWTQEDTYSHTDFVTKMIFWFLILGPVPISRIVLFDHTVEQVLGGTLGGMVGALLWWRFVRNLQRAYKAKVGQPIFFGLLLHNFPQQEKIARVQQDPDSSSSDEEEDGGRTTGSGSS